ncbi:MAG: hypothetical protein R3C69_17505 [Geminicoccaceae bacterium]
MRGALPTPAALLLPVLLLGAGCAGKTEEAAVCPDSAIIYGLDRFNGTDANGQEITATIENIDGLCQLQGETLNLDISFDILVDGPEGTPISYFVVLADPAGNVIEKASFATAVPAGTGDGTVRLREQLKQRVQDVAAGTSANYSILIGFDLPPETALEQRRDL